MKFYQSPLVIGAAVLLCYAVYLFINDLQHPESWGILLAVPMLLIAVTGFIVHFLFKKIIGNNIRMQFFIELAMLLSIVLIMLIR